MSRITDIAQEMKTWWSNEGSDIQVQSALDEIIRIDQEQAEQTEPQTWTKENCKGCKYNEYPYDSGTCFVRVCINGNKYEPKDEPQTER